MRELRFGKGPRVWMPHCDQALAMIPCRCGDTWVDRCAPSQNSFLPWPAPSLRQRPAISVSSSTQPEVSAQLPPGYHRAGGLSGPEFRVVDSRLACLGDARVGCCRRPSGFGHPNHTACNPAHEQAVAQPETRSPVGRNRTSARTLGQVRRRQERSQRVGTGRVPVPRDLR